MDKKSIDKWITIADQNVELLVNDNKINSTYDGKTAAFGVSTAMMGLKPTLAMYYKHVDKSTIQPRKILNVIAQMLNDPYGGYTSITDAKTLVEYVINRQRTQQDLSTIHKKIIECAVALKMIIRTYPQEKDQTEE